jgi:hypothetical protein
MACLKLLIDTPLKGVRIVINCNYIQCRMEIRIWSIHKENRNTKLRFFHFIRLKVGNFGVLYDAVRIRYYAVEW